MMDNFHNSMGLESSRRNASKLSVREFPEKFKGGKIDPKCGQHHPNTFLEEGEGNINSALLPP